MVFHTHNRYVMTPTLHMSEAGVTGCSWAISGEQNSGVAYLTITFLTGWNIRAYPKSMIFNSSESSLAMYRFSS